MRFLITLVLIATTTLLSAQIIGFEPARSLMNDHAVASADATFFAAEDFFESTNEFNLNFEAGNYFGDIVISYKLQQSSSVKLEIEKVGRGTMELVNEQQTSGSQKVLWDENIESGKYTIRLIVGQKVQEKTVNLSY